MKTCKLPRMYRKMTGTRSSFLTRGQDYAELSLPYILPRTSKNAGEANKHGFQGIGAEAVNHLSNKVVQALFPVSEPFFKMDLDPEVDRELTGKGFDRVKLAVYFNEITDLAVRSLNKLKLRPKLVLHEKHLIISGNSVLLFSDTGVRQLGLDKFVCKRDPEGNLIKVITKEKVAFVDLPKEIKAVYLARKNKTEKEVKDLEIDLYTGYFRESSDTFYGLQSVEDIEVYREDGIEEAKLPVIVSRWNYTSGEDYGRGLMEDHSGDFWVIEFLSEARARGASIMMDVKYLVRPGSITDIETLNTAPTGEFVAGDEEDISVLQLDKYADASLITDVMNEYKERIGRAFLMLQSSIRDSERTTKYEVQKIANELDLSMGGIYSTQAEELQMPIAVQGLERVDSRLVNKEIIPVINTGLEALGRASELEKILQYSEMMMIPQNFPDELKARLDWNAYSDLISSNLSLKTDGFFKDEESVQKENVGALEQQAGSAMADSLASSYGNELGKQLGES